VYIKPVFWVFECQQLPTYECLMGMLSVCGRTDAVLMALWVVFGCHCV
jgi:hypothetical protein